MGLLIYLIGGVGAGIANSIVILLMVRALLGVGVGLIAPLSTGLIAEFYTGNDRTKLMGYSTAALSLGGVIATLSAGFLATISWRLSSGIYLLGLVVILLVLVFLLEPENDKKTTGDNGKFPVSVYGWGVCAFLLMLAFYVAPVNLAIFIEKENIGGPAVAGLSISLMTGTSFIDGLLFARIKQVTTTFFPALLLLLMGVGYFILSQANILAQVLAATAIIGIGIDLSLPTIFIGATKAGGDGRGVQTMAVISSLAYLSQFMSPVVFGLLENMFGNGSIRFTFNIIAACFLTALLGVLAKSLFRKFDILKLTKTIGRSK